MAGANDYLAKSLADKKPATMEGLRAAIREALTNALGPPPKKKKRLPPPPPPKEDDRFIDFIGAITEIAEGDDMDPEFLASQVEPQLASKDMRNCEIVSKLISDFMEALHRRFSDDLTRLRD
jgi:hypothetical protein